MFYVRKEWQKRLSILEWNGRNMTETNIKMSLSGTV